MRLRDRLTRLMLGCAALLLLSACAAPTPTPPPAAAAATRVVESVATVQGVAQSFSLLGSEWQLESMLGTPVEPGRKPTLGFGSQRYTGFAGCDYYMGIWVARGNSLNLQAPARTLGGCVNQPQATEQQGSFLTSLQNVISFGLEDNNLVLFTTGDQKLMTLSPLQPVPLTGTVWVLSFYYNTSTAMWVPTGQGSQVTAKLDGQQISGNAGCNDYSAKYSLDGNKLKIEAIAVTNKTCTEPAGVMEQEQAYLQLLQTAGLVQQLPRSLALATADSQPLMMYHAQTP